jgi:hypothetical protein
MPRSKTSYHYYSVFVLARVEEGEELITSPDQLAPELFYSGSSERQAAWNFYRAARAAMKNPAAYSVVMWRDREVIIRLRMP